MPAGPLTGRGGPPYLTDQRPPWGPAGSDGAERHTLGGELGRDEFMEARHVPVGPVAMEPLS